MIQEAGKSGCDLKERCGFYCRFAQSREETWQIMINNYCEGSNFLLCARRQYFTQTGNCAPVDVTPIGTLPKDLLQDLIKPDENA